MNKWVWREETSLLIQDLNAGQSDSRGGEHPHPCSVSPLSFSGNLTAPFSAFPPGWEFCNQLGVEDLGGTWVQNGRGMEASNGGLSGRRRSMTQRLGNQWRDTWRGGALTTAGEAIPVQFVALMAATQEGPIGVEAALLAWSPHVTFVHIWGCQEKQERSES